MFEQSIVLDHPGSRRAGALATSLMAQIAAAGVLVIAPLVYNDVLPMVRPLAVMPPYFSPHPSRPEPVHASAAPRAAQLSLTPSKPFQAPRQINRLDYSPTMIREDPGIAWDGPVGSQVIPNFGATFSPANLAATTAPPTKAVMTTPKPVAKPVQVGGDVQAAKLIRKVVPVYPRTAVIARISGTVRLQGIIGRDGTIQQLQVVSGHPLLTGAALAAVRQWLYRPTLLNGEPVEVIAPIDVNFLLSQ